MPPHSPRLGHSPGHLSGNSAPHSVAAFPHPSPYLAGLVGHTVHQIVPGFRPVPYHPYGCPHRHPPSHDRFQTSPHSQERHEPFTLPSPSPVPTSTASPANSSSVSPHYQTVSEGVPHYTHHISLTQPRSHIHRPHDFAYRHPKQPDPQARLSSQSLTPRVSAPSHSFNIIPPLESTYGSSLSSPTLAHSPESDSISRPFNLCHTSPLGVISTSLTSSQSHQLHYSDTQIQSTNQPLLYIHRQSDPHTHLTQTLTPNTTPRYRYPVDAHQPHHSLSSSCPNIVPHMHRQLTPRCISPHFVSASPTQVTSPHLTSPHFASSQLAPFTQKSLPPLVSLPLPTHHLAPHPTPQSAPHPTSHPAPHPTPQPAPHPTSYPAPHPTPELAPHLTIDTTRTPIAHIVSTTDPSHLSHCDPSFFTCHDLTNSMRQAVEQTHHRQQPHSALPRQSAQQLPHSPQQPPHATQESHFSTQIPPHSTLQSPHPTTQPSHSLQQPPHSQQQSPHPLHQPANSLQQPPNLLQQPPHSPQQSFHLAEPHNINLSVTSPSMTQIDVEQIVPVPQQQHSLLIEPIIQPHSQHIPPPHSQHISPPHSQHIQPPHSQHIPPPHSQHIPPPHSQHIPPPHSQHIPPPQSQDTLQLHSSHTSEPVSEDNSHPHSDKPHSQLTSQPHSQLTSQPPSEHNSTPHSQPFSKTHSELPSQPSSQHTSQRHSQRSSQPHSQRSSQPHSQRSSQPHSQRSSRRHSRRGSLVSPHASVCSLATSLGYGTAMDLQGPRTGTLDSLAASLAGTLHSSAPFRLGDPQSLSLSPPVPSPVGASGRHTSSSAPHSPLSTPQTLSRASFSSQKSSQGSHTPASSHSGSLSHQKSPVTSGGVGWGDEVESEELGFVCSSTARLEGEPRLGGGASGLSTSAATPIDIDESEVMGKQVREQEDMGVLGDVSEHREDNGQLLTHLTYLTAPPPPSPATT
eukprot:GHVN01037477.1.p1 GENE.GHVN01037477.1~~GHVN01037477.1.p1  ORF type:complete len:1085 (-),score=398.88 GHVN01037477.1:64-2946(-)